MKNFPNLFYHVSRASIKFFGNKFKMKKKNSLEYRSINRIRSVSNNLSILNLFIPQSREDY